MQLHADAASGRNRFTARGPGYVMVNQARHTGNVLVFPEALEANWTERAFAALTAADFEDLAARAKAQGTDILLLGVGETQRFPAPSLIAPLIALGIGLEVMSTPAACRTFNVLVAEGRKVAAALLLDASSDDQTSQL